MKEDKNTLNKKEILKKELAFKNYLMGRKLDELLKLAINEKNRERLIYIERTIYLKVNYLDEDNKNLSGLAQYLHKQKIKKKYKGTKYERFVKIKREKIEKYLIITMLVISCFFTGTYSSKKIIEWQENRKIVPKKEYDYANKKFTRKELESILKIKIHLAEEYKKQENLQNVYLRYLNALEIVKILKNKNEINKISIELAKIKKELIKELDGNVEKLKKEFKNEEFIEKSHQAIKLSQLLQEFEKQGEIYGIKGEYSIQNKRFLEARSNFLIAKKLSNNKKLYTRKIDELEEIMAKNLLEEKEKILKIQNRGRNE